MALEELKPLVEEGNKAIAALRAEMEGRKSADIVTDEKVARIQADLAESIKGKQALEAELKAVADRLRDIETKVGRPSAGFDGTAPAEYKAAFVDYVRTGSHSSVSALQAKATDVRVATGASGGFALPAELASQVLVLMRSISPIRQIAKVVQVSTPDYAELVSAGGMGFEWVGETDTRAQTATPNFSEVRPTFGEISARPEATRQSLEDLFFDVEAELIRQGAMQFAEAEGAAFVSGDGTNKPTGILAGPTPVTTADASRAVGTLQYVATGQAAALATAPFDTFKTLQYALKSQYRANARWVMNSVVMAALATVKDTTGRYLLQQALAAGVPETIDGYPVTVAEDMPNVGAGNFPVAFGDFERGYLIADRVGMGMLRDELTKGGYVRFPMYKRVGGRLRDTQAIKLLKVAAT